MAKPRNKSFRAWMKGNFNKGELRDIANHGADAGWGGLTYTKDTVELFDAYGDEIWDMAYETAQDMGEPNVLTMAGKFNRADMADNLDGFKNLMVWFAAEQIAREETDTDNHAGW